MRDDCREIVATTAIDVLENSAMLFADQLDVDELETPDKPVVKISVEFRGASCGTLHMITTVEAALEVAANALGVDQDDEEAVLAAADAIGELGNVLLGQLLSALAGQHAIFDLGAPHVQQDVGEGEWLAFAAHNDAIAMLADEYPLMVRLQDPPSAEGTEQ